METREFNARQIFGNGTFKAKGRPVKYRLAGTERDGVVYKLPNGETGSYLYDLSTGFPLYWFKGRKTDAQIADGVTEYVGKHLKKESEALAVLTDKETIN